MMINQTVGRRRGASRMLVTLTAGALASVGVAASPSANATCASFFGLGNSADCTSTLFSAAIAIGPGAKAYAEGLFGTAFAVGAGSGAEAHDPFEFATTFGANSVATTKGLFGIALNMGARGGAQTFGTGADYGGLGFNIALNIGNPTNTGDGSSANAGGYAEAYGVGNIASNLVGGNSTEVDANGVASTATNLGGSGSPSNPLSVYVGDVSGRGLFNTAFNVLGQGNDVYAGPGPFAVAGAVLRTGATIVKTGPGIAINNVRIGGAAGTKPNSKTPAVASHRPTATARAARTAGIK